MLKKYFPKITNNFEEIVTTFFLITMCFFVFLQLLFRYLLKDPLLYAEEVARYSYIWITFIGLSLSTKTKEHIRIDFLVEKLPKKIKEFINIIIELFTLAFMIFLTYWGIRLANFNRVMLSPALRMPLNFVYYSFPFGTALASIRTIQTILNNLELLKANHKKKEIYEC